MVTNIAIGLLGLVLSIAGAIGWFRQLFPHEAHESVPHVAEEPYVATSTRTIMERPARHPASGTPRKILPIETFRITTGIRGGIAGGTAMVVPATLFSLIKYHSLWYSVNLLAAGGFQSWAGASDAFLSQFHLQGVLAGFLIQGFVSLLVGLLYGAMLPMFPRYPILTAGFMAPLADHRNRLLRAGHRQPHPQPAHRLVLVRRLAGCLWPGLRLRRQPSGPGAHAPVPGAAVPRPRWPPYLRRKSSWTSGRKEKIARNERRPLLARSPLLLPVLSLSPPLAATLRESLVPAPRSRARSRSSTSRPSTLRTAPPVMGTMAENGAAISLNNPVYLAIAGPANIQRITANGVPGTAMPPFAKSKGGMFTDQQIAILTTGHGSSIGAIPPRLAGGTPPPYASHAAPGNPAQGQQAFTTYCARCHGDGGTGGISGSQRIMVRPDS